MALAMAPNPPLRRCGEARGGWLLVPCWAPWCGDGDGSGASGGGGSKCGEARGETGAVRAEGGGEGRSDGRSSRRWLWKPTERALVPGESDRAVRCVSVPLRAELSRDRAELSRDCEPWRCRADGTEREVDEERDVDEGDERTVPPSLSSPPGTARFARSGLRATAARFDGDGRRIRLGVLALALDTALADLGIGV